MMERYKLYRVEIQKTDNSVETQLGALTRVLNQLDSEGYVFSGLVVYDAWPLIIARATDQKILGDGF